jgi:hypothetical protein
MDRASRGAGAAAQVAALEMRLLPTDDIERAIDRIHVCALVAIIAALAVGIATVLLTPNATWF